MKLDRWTDYFLIRIQFAYIRREKNLDQLIFEERKIYIKAIGNRRSQWDLLWEMQVESPLDKATFFFFFWRFNEYLHMAIIKLEVDRIWLLLRFLFKHRSLFVWSFIICLYLIELWVIGFLHWKYCYVCRNIYIVPYWVLDCREFS